MHSSGLKILASYHSSMICHVKVLIFNAMQCGLLPASFHLLKENDKIIVVIIVVIIWLGVIVMTTATNSKSCSYYVCTQICERLFLLFLLNSDWLLWSNFICCCFILLYFFTHFLFIFIFRIFLKHRMRMEMRLFLKSIDWDVHHFVPYGAIEIICRGRVKRVGCSCLD